MKKILNLIILLCFVLVFDGCNYKNVENFEKIIPVDETSFNEIELAYVNIAKNLFKDNIEINDKITEKDKFDFCLSIISTDLYNEKTQSWYDQINKSYNIPLDDIEKIITTHLNTTAFDDKIGMENCKNFDKVNRKYSSQYLALNGQNNLDLKVMSYNENISDKNIQITIGAYNLKKLLMSSPEYEIYEKYEIIFDSTYDLNKFKIISANKISVMDLEKDFISNKDEISNVYDEDIVKKFINKTSEQELNDLFYLATASFKNEITRNKSIDVKSMTSSDLHNSFLTQTQLNTKEYLKKDSDGNPYYEYSLEQMKNILDKNFADYTFYPNKSFLRDYYDENSKKFITTNFLAKAGTREIVDKIECIDNKDGTVSINVDTKISNSSSVISTYKYELIVTVTADNIYINKLISE